MGTDDGVLQEKPKDLIARHGLLWASGLREKRGRVPRSCPYIPLVVSFNNAKVDSMFLCSCRFSQQASERRVIDEVHR